MGTEIHIQWQCKRGEAWVDIQGVPDGWGRSYFLFGVLAGVRDTDPLPIAAPRGWPADIDWDDDELHHRSWLLGSEIIAHRVGTVRRHGIVSVDDPCWRDRTKPSSGWYQGVCGPRISVADLGGLVGPGTTHVHTFWDEDGDATIAPFVKFVRGLMAEHGEIRLVFAFEC